MNDKSHLLLSYVEDAFNKGKKCCFVCFNNKVAKGSSDIIKCNKKYQHYTHLNKYGYLNEGLIKLFRDRAERCKEFNCEKDETWE